MSSILKALKKIEQDPNSGDAKAGPWSQPPRLDRAFGRTPRRTLRRIVVACALLAPLVALGGWLYFKPAPQPPEKPPAASKKVAKAEKIARSGVPVPRQEIAAPKPPPPRPAPRAASPPARKTIVTSRTGVRVVDPKPAILPPVRSSPPVSRQVKPPDDLPGAESDSSGAALLNRAGRTSSPPNVSGTTRPAAGAEDSTLKGFAVQAIAWSNTPADRLAVINDRVVREGEFVDGMQVARIGLDEVSLQKDGKTWRLSCGQ